MKNFFDEFKQFALRGNVIDLAIGVIIGGAFGAIISSIVNDLAMPFFGLITGHVNLKNFHIGSVAVGDLLQNVINFVIVAFLIFIFVRFINIFKRKAAKSNTLPPSKEELLLTEIRDILKRL
jgi:large conductance mechanosensitive channel